MWNKCFFPLQEDLCFSLSLDTKRPMCGLKILSSVLGCGWPLFSEGGFPETCSIPVEAKKTSHKLLGFLPIRLREYYGTGGGKTGRDRVWEGVGWNGVLWIQQDHCLWQLQLHKIKRVNIPAWMQEKHVSPSLAEVLTNDGCWGREGHFL